jgi:multicomponent Na+:H+ antiporter subunit C
VTITLAATAAALFGIGTYLILQRKLSRIIIGLALISHGANVLLLMSGRRGAPPIIGTGDPADFSDPLPQALALTAIVITFAVTAFLLAMAYRSWLLTADDEVQDDVGDRTIAAAGYRDTEVDDFEGDDFEGDDTEDDAGPVGTTTGRR